MPTVKGRCAVWRDCGPSGQIGPSPANLPQSSAHLLQPPADLGRLLPSPSASRRALATWARLFSGRPRAPRPRAAHALPAPLRRAPGVWPCARPCALHGDRGAGLPWVARGSARRTGSGGLGDTAASIPAGGGAVRGADTTPPGLVRVGSAPRAGPGPVPGAAPTARSPGPLSAPPSVRPSTVRPSAVRPPSAVRLSVRPPDRPYVRPALRTPARPAPDRHQTRHRPAGIRPPGPARPRPSPLVPVRPLLAEPSPRAADTRSRPVRRPRPPPGGAAGTSALNSQLSPLGVGSPRRRPALDRPCEVCLLSRGNGPAARIWPKIVVLFRRGGRGAKRRCGIAVHRPPPLGRRPGRRVVASRLVTGQTTVRSSAHARGVFPFGGARPAATPARPCRGSMSPSTPGTCAGLSTACGGGGGGG